MSIWRKKKYINDWESCIIIYICLVCKVNKLAWNFTDQACRFNTSQYQALRLPFGQLAFCLTLLTWCMFAASSLRQVRQPSINQVYGDKANWPNVNLNAWFWLAVSLQAWSAKFNANLLTWQMRLSDTMIPALCAVWDNLYIQFFKYYLNVLKEAVTASQYKLLWMLAIGSFWMNISSINLIGDSVEMDFGTEKSDRYWNVKPRYRMLERKIGINFQHFSLTDYCLILRIMSKLTFWILYL